MPTQETFIKDNHYKDFLQETRAYIEKNIIIDDLALPSTPKDYFTTQQYMLRSVRKALEAATNETYGVGATLAVRFNGIELLYFGRNTLIDKRDCRGHAESNALALATTATHLNHDELAHWLKQKVKIGDVEIRRYDKHPTQQAELDIQLFTTLEPCHKCTVEILTANLSVRSNESLNPTKITTMVADTVSGGMIGQRFLNRSATQAIQGFSVWEMLASQQNLQVTVCQFDNPHDTDTYVDPYLHMLADQLFILTRERIDSNLADEGILDKHALSNINMHASRLLV